MADRRPNKNETLEALDFIVSVLKEHEKDLDRLINELGKITAKFGHSGELSTKIGWVEDRLSAIQGDVASLIKGVSSPKELTLQARGPSVIVHCKQWDDFVVMAKGAETVSFLFKEAEKSSQADALKEGRVLTYFQADALKEGRVLTYSGEFHAENSKLLQFWLARELGVAEESVFEGGLTVG